MSVDRDGDVVMNKKVLLFSVFMYGVGGMLFASHGNYAAAMIVVVALMLVWVIESMSDTITWQSNLIRSMGRYCDRVTEEKGA